MRLAWHMPVDRAMCDCGGNVAERGQQFLMQVLTPYRSRGATIRVDVAFRLKTRCYHYPYHQQPIHRCPSLYSVCDTLPETTSDTLSQYLVFKFTINVLPPFKLSRLL